MQQCGTLIRFNSFWTVMELYGTGEEDISGLMHTQYLLVDTFINGFGLPMGFVENLNRLTL